MIFIFSNQIGFIEVFALIISFFALFATLRKKEYGKFWFVEIKENTQELIIIHLIKADIYEVKISFEPYKDLNILVEIKHENNSDIALFINELKPYSEIGFIKQGSFMKFHVCKSSNIYISYRDKYNNLYSQTLTQNSIIKRLHKNIWNLTFIGS